MNDLSSLIENYVAEAKTAPRLFSDLAKVEEYIGESYKTRALIELIQNADDAGATTFGLHDFANGLAVGNNGRAFTLTDIEALCRSGASQKQRNGTTIGYRGIGFKSVVNLASQVFVFSGDHSFYFCKQATKRLFPDATEVPLIRIPHLLNSDLLSDVGSIAKELADEHHYETLFVFLGLDERLSAAELSSFDRGSMLFLRNLETIRFELSAVSRLISRQAKVLHERTVVELIEGQKIDCWEVMESDHKATSKVAFKCDLESGDIVPAEIEESVFHSFTPTEDYAGARLKINGDFSTDPSRKTIDMDERSQSAFEDAVELLKGMVLALMNGESVRKDLFSVFVDGGNTNRKRSNPKLLEQLAKLLKDSPVKNSAGESAAFSSLRLRPEWLNYDDYLSFEDAGITCLKKELIGSYPSLLDFLRLAGNRVINLNEVIEHANKVKLSTLGAAQIFARIVDQMRYSLGNTELSSIQEMRIFPNSDDELLKASGLRATNNLHPKFVQHLLDNCELPDLRLFLSKLNIEAGVDFQPKLQVVQPNVETVRKSLSHNSPTQFRITPNIKKWRSGEQNAEEYFRALAGVASVTDISKANVGYDLEAILENGEKLYIEVKNVSSFGDPFKLTNNEYTTAHQYGDSYFLAIIINSTPFQIRLIRNPVETLQLHKQCERWAWSCDDYFDQLVEATIAANS